MVSPPHSPPHGLDEATRADQHRAVIATGHVAYKAEVSKQLGLSTLAAVLIGSDQLAVIRGHAGGRLRGRREFAAKRYA